MYSTLRPQAAIRLNLKNPTGAPEQVDVAAKIQNTRDEARLGLTGADGASDIWDLIRQEETQEHLMRARYTEHGDQVTVVKVPNFDFSLGEVENMLSKARKHQSLVLHLRGNPGGAIDTLKYFVGGMFDKQVKIADRVGRVDTKPELAKTMRNPYLGKLVVLVDARSASCAELFARIILLEKARRSSGRQNRRCGHGSEALPTAQWQ